MKNIIASLILQEKGKLSWSKFTIWAAGVLALIVELNAQLIAAGITIPAEFLPVIKTASIASAIIAGIRLRTAAGNKQSTPEAKE